MRSKRFIEGMFHRGFLIVSTTSMVALIAIIVFVFVQGLTPFLRPTSQGPRLIPDGMDALVVNGVEYLVADLPRGEKYIELDNDDDHVLLSFGENGTQHTLSLRFDHETEAPRDRVVFEDAAGGELSYPEEYIYTLSYPGTMAGLETRLHVVIPQKPENFFSEFLFDAEWRPTYKKEYGILTMVWASLLSTFGAMILGIPLGLFTALFLAEFVRPGPGRLIRGAVDLLAGIPSVVYGFFGLMMVVPLIKRIFGTASGSSLLAAVIILALMMLPTVIAVSEVSIRAVPRRYREGSLALGATKMQTAWRVVFPAAGSGIVTGVVLGACRAVGETMAIMMVAGNSPQFPSRLTDGVRTLTATIALEMGYAQGRHNRMLFSIGVVLFIMILSLNTLVLVFKNRMVERRS